MNQTTFTVQGMTCSHCVLSVREEVSEVPGVSLEGVEERIRNKTPYRVTRATMVVEGLCPACAGS